MLFEYYLPEKGSVLKEQEDQFERKLLVSKLKSLNDHLSNLLQKKIRIDLEIKRTKKKLSKLKNSSMTYVKSKIELEGFILEHYNPRECNPQLLEQVGEEIFLELLELDQLIDQAEQLEREVETIPLAE